MGGRRSTGMPRGSTASTAGRRQLLPPPTAAASCRLTHSPRLPCPPLPQGPVGHWLPGHPHRGVWPGGRLLPLGLLSGRLPRAVGAGHAGASRVCFVPVYRPRARGARGGQVPTHPRWHHQVSGQAPGCWPSRSLPLLGRTMPALCHRAVHWRLRWRCFASLP